MTLYDITFWLVSDLHFKSCGGFSVRSLPHMYMMYYDIMYGNCHNLTVIACQFVMSQNVVATFCVVLTLHVTETVTEQNVKMSLLLLLGLHYWLNRL